MKGRRPRVSVSSARELVVLGTPEFGDRRSWLGFADLSLTLVDESRLDLRWYSAHGFHNR